MESQQRGAKSGCSGTDNNLLIDRMMIQNCVRGKRNISMAWIDVQKAYDSVDQKDRSMCKELVFLVEYQNRGNDRDWSGNIREDPT